MEQIKEKIQIKEDSYIETIKNIISEDVTEYQYRAMMITLLRQAHFSAYDVVSDGAALLVLKNGHFEALARDYRDAYYYLYKHKPRPANSLELL